MNTADGRTVRTAAPVTRKSVQPMPKEVLSRLALFGRRKGLAGGNEMVAVFISEIIISIDHLTENEFRS